jgi:hypothetical protein
MGGQNTVLAISARALDPLNDGSALLVGWFVADVGCPHRVPDGRRPLHFEVATLLGNPLGWGIISGATRGHLRGCAPLSASSLPGTARSAIQLPILACAWGTAPLSFHLN